MAENIEVNSIFYFIFLRSVSIFLQRRRTNLISGYYRICRAKPALRGSARLKRMQVMGLSDA